MNPGSTRRPARLTLVTAPGCHFCEDAHRALTGLIEHGAAIELEVVQATSPLGLALLAEHRPAMNPLVLIDRRYFSAGRLPMRKLQAFLARRSENRIEEATSRG
ncbi:MAG TPA: glutaredoxin [Propionicimonas sp.]|jgi:glutaredoxin